MTSIFTPQVVQPVSPTELRSGVKQNWSPPALNAPAERQGFTPMAKASVSDTKPTSAMPAPAPTEVQGQADPEKVPPSALKNEPEKVVADVVRSLEASSSDDVAPTPSPSQANPADDGRNPADDGRNPGLTVSELAFAPEKESGPDAVPPHDPAQVQAAYHSALETTNAYEPAQLLMTA